jgi:hypothetical protein
MLAQIATTFVQLFHLIGFCVLLWGVLLLVGALLSMKGPDAYLKGGVLILIGNWVARLAG